MLGGQRGLCRHGPERRWELPLLGTCRYPGRNQLVLGARGAIPTQPNPRALHRGAAFNKQEAQEGEQSTAGPATAPELCRESHLWVPNLFPVPSRARSSQLLAQSTAGVVTPSLVWLHGVDPLAALGDAVLGWIGAGVFELSLPGHPEPAANERGWGEPTLGASLCLTRPQVGSLPSTGTSCVGSSCSRPQPAPFPRPLHFSGSLW